MNPNRVCRLLSAGVILFLFFLVPVHARDGEKFQPTPPPESSENISVPETSAASVEAVVVNPYRSANVGTQVGGSILKFNFEEGDFIQEGQVVVELDTVRYSILYFRALERLKGMEAALTRAKEEASIKEELFRVDATTRQELIKARSEEEVARHRTGEAKRELDLARYELDCCKIKAPFSGYLATKFKQPDESVERLEKLFLLVDSSRVFCVANVPETMLYEFKKGVKGTFVYSPTKTFSGFVERIGRLIDPKSKTKRVYLLVDNSSGELELGMTGILQLVK